MTPNEAIALLDTLYPWGVLIGFVLFGYFQKTGRVRETWWNLAAVFLWPAFLLFTALALFCFGLIELGRWIHFGDEKEQPAAVVPESRNTNREIEYNVAWMTLNEGGSLTIDGKQHSIDSIIAYCFDEEGLEDIKRRFIAKSLPGYHMQRIYAEIRELAHRYAENV